MVERHGWLAAESVPNLWTLAAPRESTPRENATRSPAQPVYQRRDLSGLWPHAHLKSCLLLRATRVNR
jgi:hypothetical protein